MSEPTPELRWAPIEPKPKNTGRVWLIVGIVVAVLAIIGALLFFLLPRGESPTPEGTVSPSPSATASPSPSASSIDPSAPETTPPTPTEPSLDLFREQVGGWLKDAPRGLDIIARADAADALPVVDTLEQDARRLSDAQAPSSISTQWREGVSAYSMRLEEVRTAISSGSGSGSGSDSTASLEAARTAVQDLHKLVGL